MPARCAAITTANGTGAIDTISFSTLGAGVHTINLLSALPAITRPIIIDGNTAPGFVAGTTPPLIVLNGAGAGLGANGLQLNGGSSGSTIRGLNIQGFQPTGAGAGGDGINIQGGSNNNTITGNFIGTNQTGTSANGNAVGIFVTNSTGNTIGGTTAALRNIVSGNTVDGIQLRGGGTATSNNLVRNNYIGLDATGTVALGNANEGVADLSVVPPNNTVGGTVAGAGNVISANGGVGLRFTNAGTDDNFVQGNFIGLDATGTAASVTVSGTSVVSPRGSISATEPRATPLVEPLLVPQTSLRKRWALGSATQRSGQRCGYRE